LLTLSPSRIFSPPATGRVTSQKYTGVSPNISYSSKNHWVAYCSVPVMMAFADVLTGSGIPLQGKYSSTPRYFFAKLSSANLFVVFV
jgi:hypothetical protein